MSMLSVKPVPIPVVIPLVWKSRSLVFQFLLLVQWVEDDFHNIPPLRTLAPMKLPFRCLTSTKNSRNPRIRRQYFSLNDMLVIFHSLRGSVIGCRFHRDLASAPTMSLVLDEDPAGKTSFSSKSISFSASPVPLFKSSVELQGVGKAASRALHVSPSALTLWCTFCDFEVCFKNMFHCFAFRRQIKILLHLPVAWKIEDDSCKVVEGENDSVFDIILEEFVED
ncbi:hypothetical protein F5890DRAFT_583040 [Lentinula detonsa]|uniref:Uncharacterized protein n=1 Tax=Lentinula detonsa TaxID=2804962 RepID=A0AA38UWJ8_9AGAR|nr:hypothetical protein F5890DRAFT_583040 [Lentinula detonsa]